MLKEKSVSAIRIKVGEKYIRKVEYTDDVDNAEWFEEPITLEPLKIVHAEITEP